MKINIIGERFEQSKKLSYILENIENCEIHFINTEKNLLDQIEQVYKYQKIRSNILYEIKKSNKQQFQENVISQLKKSYRQLTLILLIQNDQSREQAIKLKNQSNRFFNVQICNLIEYFQKYYGYDKHVDLNEQKIAMFISNKQDIKNKIFKFIKSPAKLEKKWALINTPQFNMNQEAEQKNEMINEFSSIFKKYQNQISLLFIIVDYERDDIIKQNFIDLYTPLKKFKQKMIVLLYNRFDVDLEDNSTLNKYFINYAKIREVYQLSNSQLQNQQQIDEYFNMILEQQQDKLEIGIDMKDTIFEITDEIQSEIEQQTFELDFYKTKVQQLKESVDQDVQQIILNQQKIEELKRLNQELERSKYQKQSQINEMEREISLKQKSNDKIQKETQIQQQITRNSNIPQKQASQMNQAIVDINDSQTLTQQIQYLQIEKESISKQLTECYSKKDKISINYQGKKQKELEEQLNSQIKDLWNKLEENDLKNNKYKIQLGLLQQDIEKDNQKCEQTNYPYNSQNTNNIEQISKYYSNHNNSAYGQS